MSVGKEMGIDDPRRTVGAVWFDMDRDGDLDVFVGNQNGDLNGLFRNDGARFVDVAKELGVDAAGRPRRPAATVRASPTTTTMATSICSSPGTAATSSTATMARASSPTSPRRLASPGARWRRHRVGEISTTTAGSIVYVSSYIDKPINERDFLYHNDGGRFTDVIPENIAKRGATHGIQWVDFDKDGDLDFSLANNNPNGTHSLYRNLLPPERARQSIQVLVQDARGRATNAGAEVRVYAAGTRKLLGAGIVDSGGGYASQNVIPVHVGLGTDAAVDVEVTTMGKGGRKVTKLSKMIPGKIPGRVLVVKAG